MNFSLGVMIILLMTYNSFLIFKIISKEYVFNFPIVNQKRLRRYNSSDSKKIGTVIRKLEKNLSKFVDSHNDYSSQLIQEISNLNKNYNLDMYKTHTNNYSTTTNTSSKVKTIHLNNTTQLHNINNYKPYIDKDGEQCQCGIEKIKDEYLSCLDKITGLETQIMDLINENNSQQILINSYDHSERSTNIIDTKSLTEDLNKLKNENTILQTKLEKLNNFNNDFVNENKFLNSALNKANNENHLLQQKYNNDNQKYKLLNDLYNHLVHERDTLELRFSDEIGRYKKEIDELQKEILLLNNTRKLNSPINTVTMTEYNNKNDADTIMETKDNIVINNALTKVNQYANRNSNYVPKDSKKTFINSPMKSGFSPLKTEMNLDAKKVISKFKNRNIENEIKNILGESLTKKILKKVNKNREQEYTSLNDLLSADEDNFDSSVDGFQLEEDDLSVGSDLDNRDDRNEIKKQRSSAKLKKEKLSVREMVPRIHLSTNNQFNFFDNGNKLSRIVNYPIVLEISFVIKAKKRMQKLKSKRYDNIVKETLNSINTENSLNESILNESRLSRIFDSQIETKTSKVADTCIIM